MSRRGNEEEREEKDEEEEEVEKDSEVEEEEDEGEDSQHGDGLSNVMSKILNQSICKKIPVLAKRRTAVMKEIEESREQRDRLKIKRIEKNEDRER